MMRWSKGASHEGLSMLWLAMRVRTTTGRSHVGLVAISVTMHGLHQLQLVLKRLWPSKLFMSSPSVNTCKLIPTTASLQGYG